MFGVYNRDFATGMRDLPVNLRYPHSHDSIVIIRLAPLTIIAVLPHLIDPMLSRPPDPQDNPARPP